MSSEIEEGHTHQDLCQTQAITQEAHRVLINDICGYEYMICTSDMDIYVSYDLTEV